jgi:hypothetical protein
MAPAGQRVHTILTKDAKAKANGLPTIHHLRVMRPLTMRLTILPQDVQVGEKVQNPLAETCRKCDAAHDFAPHTPPKKQFMYWGADPESAAVMLIDRFVNNLAHILPSHYQLTQL